MTDLQKSDAVLASQKAPTFEREDWSLFRTLEGLQQRAGVSKNLLSRLVLKELADNGLDNGAKVTVESLPYEGGYVVEDDGTGIEGSPEDIARLFSIKRPMVFNQAVAAAHPRPARQRPARGRRRPSLLPLAPLSSALATGEFAFGQSATAPPP